MESEESLLKYTFYQYVNSSDEKNEDKWQLYSLDNQKLLNVKYESFLQDKSQVIANLIGNSKSYFVNFELMMQISNNQEDLRPIKIVETNKIVDEIGALNISDDVYNDDLDNLKFFWKANEDSFYYKEAPKWSPYYVEDQKVLKSQFEIYI